MTRRRRHWTESARIKGPEHRVLGRVVRELRVRRGLSQEALMTVAAERGFKLHRNYVGAIERGEINPTFSVLIRVADALGFGLPVVLALWEERWEEDQQQRARERRGRRGR